jgi:hypothetical protein
MTLQHSSVDKLPRIFPISGVMNKIFGWLLVVVLVAAAFANKDKIAAWRGGAAEEEVVPPEPPPVVEVAPPRPTPHPAAESQALATKLYRGLSIPGSALNKKFLELHAEAKANDPALLASPDWPIILAERAMVAMGGTPLSRTAPVHTTPKPLPGTAMDKKPGVPK